ncbi:DUF5408 family protein [Helicobacter enhydrae]|uniref:DUF5408 family protein n=1 Tax=Helicobacter enhydrae TaxID=222136 RepID=UPI0018FF791A|nr:DUF5408 family protein [Helicobacter enhydrae]
MQNSNNRAIKIAIFCVFFCVFVSLLTLYVLMIQIDSTAMMSHKLESLEKQVQDLKGKQ